MASLNTTTNSSTDLLFITNTNGRSSQDAATRTRIKKHVMKNIGVTRRRPRRSRTQSIQLQVLPVDSPEVVQRYSPARVQEVYDSQESESSSASPEEYINLLPSRTNSVSSSDSSQHSSLDGSEDSLAVIARNIADNDRQVSPELCPVLALNDKSEYLLRTILHFDSGAINLRWYRDHWYWLSLLDPAAHHQINALTTSYIRAQCPQAVAHRDNAAIESTKAIALVNEHMKDSKRRLSDGVIVTILALIVQADVENNHDNHSIHIAGLRSIIQKRGGIECLSSNKVLQRMISYFDTISACVVQDPPYFPLPLDMPSLDDFCGNVTIPALARSIAVDWEQGFAPHAIRVGIFRDATRLIARLEQRTMGDPYSDTLLIGSLILGIFHRLCSDELRCLDGESSRVIADSTRIATILCLSEPRRRIGVIPGYPSWYLVRLSELMCRPEADWTGLHDLKLWILTSAVKEAGASHLGRWFESERQAALHANSEHRIPYLEQEMNELFPEQASFCRVMQAT